LVRARKKRARAISVIAGGLAENPSSQTSRAPRAAAPPRGRRLEGNNSRIIRAAGEPGCRPRPASEKLNRAPASATDGHHNRPGRAQVTDRGHGRKSSTSNLFKISAYGVATERARRGIHIPSKNRDLTGIFPHPAITRKSTGSAPAAAAALSWSATRPGV
jgi:hypothetical protein